MVYTMNPDKFIEAYNILNAHGLNVTDYSDTAITGTITVSEPGILMFSIPYDPSWSLKVNGVKTDTIEVAEALLGVSLEPGEYTIELCFTPRGFKLGLIISITSVFIIFIIYCFYRKEAGKGFLPFTKAKKLTAATNEGTVEETIGDDACNENAETGENETTES